MCALPSRQMMTTFKDLCFRLWHTFSTGIIYRLGIFKLAFFCGSFFGLPAHFTPHLLLRLSYIAFRLILQRDSIYCSSFDQSYHLKYIFTMHIFEKNHGSSNWSDPLNHLKLFIKYNYWKESKNTLSNPRRLMQKVFRIVCLKVFIWILSNIQISKLFAKKTWIAQLIL